MKSQSVENFIIRFFVTDQWPLTRQKSGCRHKSRMPRAITFTNIQQNVDTLSQFGFLKHYLSITLYTHTQNSAIHLYVQYANADTTFGSTAQMFIRKLLITKSAVMKTDWTDILSSNTLRRTLIIYSGPLFIGNQKFLLRRILMRKIFDDFFLYSKIVNDIYLVLLLYGVLFLLWLLLFVFVY